MNPRASHADSTKSDIRTSPFEQITGLENEQEVRVQQALETAAAEERDAVKAMQNSDKLHEDKLRDEARKDLKEFAQKEPAAILTKGEEETSAELTRINDQYKKNSPKALTSLVDSVLAL